MKDRVLRILTMLSLSLLILVLLFVVLSPLLSSSRNYAIRRLSDGSQWTVGISNWGTLRIAYAYPYPGVEAVRKQPRMMSSQAIQSSEPLPVVYLQRQRRPELLQDGSIVWHPQITTAWIKCGWLVIPFSILPLWTALHWIRLYIPRRRAARGLCPHCGYDLRATPERCPECGERSKAHA